MASENNTTVVGNVTRDPELRYLSNGQATTQFGLAVNRRWQKNGEWQEATSFFNVVIWRDMAENFAESITKGTRVIVTGRLEQRSWDDAQTGAKRSVVEIVADEVGPSLRWATAQVTKTERSGGSNGGGAPARSAAPASVPAEDSGFEPFGGSSGGDEPF